jgi:WXG100 protein secretion system (Wss), protein YukD
MSTVLVTLRGPGGEEDLVAPADTSVERLIPALLEAVAPPGQNGNNAEWELAVPGKPALEDEQTLAEQGVIDGSVLQLRRRGEDFDLAPERHDRGAEDGLLPVARTRELLPDRLRPPARLRVAFEAARNRSDDTTRIPSFRKAWRETNYLRSLERQLASARLDRALTIAVVSPPGGGGSTITALLGSLLATVRSERVLAVDSADLAGIGPGGLAGSRSGIREIALRPSIDGMLALAGPSRLAAPAEPDEERSADAIHSLRSVTDLLLLDCTAEDPVTEAALAAADQVVVIVDAGDAEGRARARLLKPPAGDAPYIAVVNRELRIRPLLDLHAVERRIPDARGLVVVNNDKILADRLASRSFSWADDPKGTWPRSIRELALVLATDWGERG